MPEESEDEGAPGLPPHPLDRVWFHPSELGAATATSERPPRISREWGIAALAALCGVVVTLGILAATGSLGTNHSATDEASGFVPVFARLQSDHAAELVATAGASVVGVRIVTEGGGSAVASGVSLGGDRIVTSADLVQGATSASVTTDHGHVLTAKVVGSDPETDVAVLKVEGARVPEASIGSTDGLEIGTWVLAVGSAGGERHWASQGVVSGLNVLVDRGGGATMPGMVSTDVDIPAGSGGGVLLDDDGSVIAILSRAAPGHAVPIEDAREVAEQLGANGRVRHAWLGIDAVDAATRAGGGVVVQAVSAGGPGETAALLPGDVITSLGDERVADLADLIAAVAHRRPGDPVELTVFRGDRRLRVSATLAERP